ncbi:transglutaminaseTgpA domain-containing protein [Demequina muriae]|uniref:TransglutaminaseTgpA domain-containing protein n=1 Tax=Demequina muriae TaxID=3051664 RepID=A0ABT8GGT8_9MICO|nr:transglutaminaseTgpA domain-containing protein [Demequina sp. EGI L300058]MDN4480579.1 transglutaminaseTgpA domain-containing protein [Demequina sp. EGI L300058]
MAAARRGAPGRATWTFVLINAVFVMGGAAIAAWSLLPVFESWRYVLTVGVAIVAGAAIAVACERMRRGPGLALVLALLVYVGGGALLAIPGALGGPEAWQDAAVDLVRGPVLGWKDLVTLPLPLGEYRATLVPVFALFLTATLLATWAAVRARRAWGLGAVVLAGLLVAGVAIGPAVRADALTDGLAGTYVTREFAVGLALFFLVLSWFGWRAAHTRHRAIAIAQEGAEARLVRRPHVRVLGGVAAVLAIIVVATAAATVVSGPIAAQTPRDVARTAIDPRLTLAESVSPLASYRSYFEDDAYDAVLFSVTPSEGSPEHVRLASLAHFDGETFSASAGPDEAPVRFQRVPSTIAPEPGTTTVRADVTVGAGGGIWVPLLGPLGSVDFHGPRQAQLIDGFYYLADGATGVMGAEGGIVAGDSYTVEGHVPVEPGVLADLGASPGAATIDTELIPPSLSDWVTLQNVTRDGAGLHELLTRLRERGYLSHALDAGETAANWEGDLPGYAFASSAAGHSYDRIDRLFASLIEREEAVATNPGASLVAAVGDDEQFAAAAALVAAELGFPSRVVVGVRLAQTDESGWTVPPCDGGECRGRNLAAWVEVQGSDGTWVQADVSPQYEAPLSPELSQQTDPEYPSALDPERAEPIVPPSSQRGMTDEDPSLDEDADGQAGWILTAVRIGGIGLLVLLVLCGPFLLVVAWKAARRSRRRKGAPADVVHGGWDEYVDTAVEAGMEPMPLATRAEMAAAYGSGHGSRIATVTDRATFSGGGTSAAEAEEFWALIDADRAAWLAQRGWWARLRMRVSLRSVWHSVATPAPKPEARRRSDRPQWRAEHTARTGSRRSTGRSRRRRPDRRRRT